MNNAYEVVNLKQGSPEWLEWRSAGVGASEVAALLGESPFMTALQLYELKKGIRQAQESNYAMARGNDLEPEARAAFEADTGELVSPLCIQLKSAPAFRASLDGITMDGSTIVEIKVPGEATLEMAALGDVPAHYMIQIQYQLMISNAERAIFYAYDYKARRGYCVEVLPDLEMQQVLQDAVTKFMKCLADSNPPSATDRDVEVRSDSDWEDAASEYKALKEELDALSKKADAAKKKLQKLAGDKSCMGAGVRVTRSSRQGSVDYSKVPELKDVNLEQYRKKASVVYTVTISK